MFVEDIFAFLGIVCCGDQLEQQIWHSGFIGLYYMDYSRIMRDGCKFYKINVVMESLVLSIQKLDSFDQFIHLVFDGLFIL